MTSRSDTRVIQAIDAHAGGGLVRLVVAGLPFLPGRTLDERRRAATEGEARHLMRALLTEPRGVAGMAGAVLAEPGEEGAHAGVLFFRGDAAPSFSGHALIGVATIAVERGLISGLGLGPTLLLETPAGTCRVIVDTASAGAAGSSGRDPTDPAAGIGPRDVEPGSVRARRVTYEGPEASVVAGGLPVAVGNRTLRLDVVESGGLLALVDSEAAGVVLAASRVPEMRRAALEIHAALDAPLARLAPDVPLDAVVFTAASESADLRSATVRDDGSVERAPSGRATAAILSVLDAMGVMPDERSLIHEGLAGLRFEARIARRLEKAGRPSVVPEVTGSAWITGEHRFLLQPDDPLRFGLPDE
jgi:proline racemase